MSIDTGELVSHIEDLLTARDVKDIDSFDWSGGFAMWIEQPPYEHAVEEWQDDQPPKRAPTDAEQRLMELAGDFGGLMKAARFQIGSALLHREDVPAVRVDAMPFDYHVTGALVSMAMAADRLRDLLIVGVLGELPKRHKEGKQVSQAIRSLLNTPLKRLVPELEDVGHLAEEVKGVRNDAVHDLATIPGFVQRHLVGGDKKAFQRGSWERIDRGKSYAEMIRASEEADRGRLAELDAKVDNLIRWYGSLVAAGELIFRTEYQARPSRLARSPQ